MARQIDEKKRAEILRAAQIKFASKGFSNTAMSEIAQEAGIAHGTLYLYFPSKEGIATALSEEFFKRLAEIVIPAADQSDSLDEVMAVVANAVAFVEQERETVRLINIYAHGSAQPPSMPARLGFYRKLSRVFHAKMGRRIIKAHDPQVAAELVIGLIEWVAVSVSMREGSEMERYRPTLLAFIRSALAP